MKIKRLLITVLIFGIAWTATSQERDLITSDSLMNPYRQGRWVAGVSGFVSSSSTGKNFSEKDTASFNNGHQVSLQIGYFVSDQLPLGAFISSRSQNSFETFERESENLFIGLWSRYYLVPKNAGLYPEFSVFYTHFFNQNQLLSGSNREIDSSIVGSGLGLSAGLGFSYVLEDLLIFDINLNYHFFRIRGDFTDHILNVTEKRSFSVQEASFSFGFKILIRK